MKAFVIASMVVAMASGSAMAAGAGHDKAAHKAVVAKEGDQKASGLSQAEFDKANTNAADKVLDKDEVAAYNKDHAGK